jgi:poly(3-hydroxybutyrate) depolymerase
MKHVLLSVITLFIFTVSQAQCDGRYQEEIFDEVSVTTLTYSNVNNLQLDIYQAEGDTKIDRPLIILAHGGTFVVGVRTNPTMISLAETFAKRGYVVASISYRLMSFPELISTPIEGVVRALSDGKAAVRYFRKTVAEGNAYHIDPDQIYFGGNSAGAVIALHIAFMQEEDITDPSLLDALNNNGGIEGNSGNEDYSSEIKGAISLAGGVVDVNFITESDFDNLLISCHGNEDTTVPYLCGQPLSISTFPKLCGGGAILEHSTTIGFDKHHHLDFEGAGHVPWEFSNSSKDAMIHFVSEHLYNNLDCANVDVGAEEPAVSRKPYIFPNPTERMFTIESSKKVNNVIVNNLNGVIVFRSKNSSNINIEHLPQGVYMVEIHDENQKITHTKVVKL